jgi:KUP system potassium uptake protein
VARYGYRDPFEEAKDFVDKLVEHLQYYIRDVNLYGVGCEPMMKQSSSYRSSHAESFSSHEKPKVKAVYAEEMLTPAESFSEHARQASGKSKRFAQFQVTNLLHYPHINIKTPTFCNDLVLSVSVNFLFEWWY